ncbi:MAG: 50S ribosomal protein L35 [Legionellales bacterium]|nr:MAG: 50S ribosomal protein L35 [Legionellales bacterium]
MSKMKTKSAAKKRFRSKGNGGYKMRRANRAHIKTKQTRKLVRQSRGNTDIKACETNAIARMLKDK